MSSKLVNAWIFLNEDEPSGTNYNSPDSSYQRLIHNNVYHAVDILCLCFATTVITGPRTVPTGDGTQWTLQMGQADHPGGLTNQDYMDYIIRDARAQNPNIKICMTLLWGNADTLSQIFSNTTYSAAQNATFFANNLVRYLAYYDLDGFDVDWESPISSGTSKQQFITLFTAIGIAFKNASKKYYLTLSPASVGNLDATTVNNNFDFVNLQLYSGFTFPSSFEQAGINPNLFAYGAKFESNFQTAQEAVNDNNTNYDYPVMINWRLNSDNFIFEQDQQVLLYQLFKG
ncbi:MAG: glycosyl hydrolase family 18 protein [Aureispira sp.]